MGVQPRRCFAYIRFKAVLNGWGVLGTERAGREHLGAESVCGRVCQTTRLHALDDSQRGVLSMNRVVKLRIVRVEKCVVEYRYLG